MFKENDNVLVTCQILRKGQEGPETVNLSSEPGVVKKARTYKDAGKNTYHVETQYGIHMINESKLVVDPA